MNVEELRQPLPPRLDARKLIRRAAQAISPPEDVSVGDCAARHRRLNNPGSYVGPWRNETTPWLVEPMDRSISREIGELYFIGPSQISAKTELLQNHIAHAIMYRPADILMIQPTFNMAQDFAFRRIQSKFLGPSPDLSKQLGSRRSDDKTMVKRFRNGTTLALGWPTASQMASRPLPTVMLDERDRMTDDIDGEGDPVALARKRLATYGVNGILLCTSSPSRDDWSGIVPHFYQGDQRLWHWPCPECGDYWAAGFDQDRKPTVEHLRWDDGGPEVARDTAHLVCPCCGCVIEERHKVAMNARGLWLALGQTADTDGAVHGAAPKTRVASYWFCGIASNLGSWGELAAEYVAAEQHFERTGDESKLRTVVNTGFGFPYESRVSRSDPVPADALEARAETSSYGLGTVPDGVEVLTAAVDVQGDRFACLVMGWGEGLESWVIDRHDVRVSVEKGRQVRIDPARFAEHWDTLLDAVVWRKYATADGREAPVFNVAVDTGGMEGVTDQAYAFWFRALDAGVPETSLTLVKGGNKVDARTLPQPTYDVRRKVPGYPDPPLFVPNVNRLKDMLDTRLRAESPGPLHVHFPADLPAEYFAELVAEKRVGGVWQRDGATPNETLDLMVYCHVALIRHGGQDGSMAWVKALAPWARPSTPQQRKPQPRRATWTSAL